MFEALNYAGQAIARGALQNKTDRAGGEGSRENQTAVIAKDDRPAENSLQRLKPIEKIEKSLTNILQSSLGENSRLSIERHEASGRYIYRSIDKTSGEVISQWPVEGFLSHLEKVIEVQNAEAETAGLALDEEA